MAAVAALGVALGMSSCGGGGGGGGGGETAAPPAAQRVLSVEAALGEKIFNDVSLSASGRLSCASCHVGTAGHAQDNALAAQLGGADLSLQGSRTSPSIRYLAFAPAFSMDSSGTPQGGLFWDGRASSLADQAGRPFLNPREMALRSADELALKLNAARYVDEFRRVFGADILMRPDQAIERVKQALQQFELEDTALRTFSSKYDEFLRGRATLSESEQRGLAVFNSTTKGNCQSCHPSAPGNDGRPPLFTNFTYHALGVPRNDELAVNADATHFDLGLCAREAGDLVARGDLCGAFRVPSLRNVALRQALFHNGRFKNLRAAVGFYARRDTHPEQFYPRHADGSVHKFDDLPPTFRGNVSRAEAPYDRNPGQSAALSETEIDDVVAFLGILTDGWAR